MPWTDEKNQFPVPQWKWREAEDRASKYKQLLELAGQEISKLKAQHAFDSISKHPNGLGQNQEKK